MQAADINRKFEALAIPVFGQEPTKALLECWWDVTRLATLTEALNRLDRG